MNTENPLNLSLHFYENSAIVRYTDALLTRPT